jgi:hypothetical protein
MNAVSMALSLAGLWMACVPVVFAADGAPTSQTNQPGRGANANRAVSDAYQSDRARLQDAQSNLRQVEPGATDSLKQQLRNAQEQLNALTQRLEEAARASEQTTLTAARKLEESIGLRARRLEARSLLLAAKANTDLAKKAAAKQDFELAERRLADATEFLRRARATLYGDNAYDDELDDTEAALHEASFAIKSHAQNAQAKIARVLKDTDRVVGSLESDEQRLAVIKGE